MKDRHGKKLKATGDCMMNSAKFVIDNQDDSLTLVHCIVTGTGPKIKGIDYAHAFVIMDIGLALDLTKSFDKPTIVPLEFYRQIGNVRNEIKYTWQEANRLTLESGHWGPWDESISTDADKFCKASKV